MNGQILDQIIAILRRDGNLTPFELLNTCKEEVKMDTLAFCNALVHLERIGLIVKASVRNKDNSGSTVYCLDRVRSDAQKYGVK